MRLLQLCRHGVLSAGPDSRYDLDRWAGELVMSVLQTHPRIFVNGLVLDNPYYLPVRQFLEILGA